MRITLRTIVASVLYCAGLTPLYIKVGLRNRALVLMYHRVVDAREGVADPGMFVTRRAFELQMRYLASLFELVSLDDLRDWALGNRTWRRTPCAVTFDDGWADNYWVAFPILKALGVPATVFLVTDQIGTPEMLTWEQAREMERAGVSFGSHTATHPRLTTVDAARVQDEIERSKARLDRELSRPSSWFCYPKGDHNTMTRAIIERGFEGALTVEPGPVRRGDDLFALRRIGIHNDIASTVPLFALRLAQARS